jgi:basic membrane lipoprotein Med (substrate-binding protein (PBP1-ABC) superfamily)
MEFSREEIAELKQKIRQDEDRLLISTDPLQRESLKEIIAGDKDTLMRFSDKLASQPAQSKF